MVIRLAIEIDNLFHEGHSKLVVCLYFSRIIFQHRGSHEIVLCGLYAVTVVIKFIIIDFDDDNEEIVKQFKRQQYITIEFSM